MEASAIPASVGLARTRVAIGASLLRFRTDEQLVTLFREGNDDAFRVIHDRYRARLVAYTRQMLGATGQDPEDAVQEIFVRAYYGLRASHRNLALRAWLYRIAHNRCVDDLRRPRPVTVAVAEQTPARTQDPVTKAEQRDALRRLIADVQRLPEHQRSALLMRELSGMPYTEVSEALGVSVPAVKSLLVRARIGLAQASEARNTACADIRADVILAHDRGVRTSGLARRHMRECQSCRQFRAEVRGVSRQFAALTPTLGPLGVIANLLGLGGGGSAAAGGAAGGGAIAGGSAAATGTVGTSAGVLAGGTSHVVTLLAAAVVTAGGAVEIQRTLTSVSAHPARVHRVAGRVDPDVRPAPVPTAAVAGPTPRVLAPPVPEAASNTPSPTSASSTPAPPTAAQRAAATRRAVTRAPISMRLDPDMYRPPNPNGASSGASSGPTSSIGSAGGGGSTTGTSGSGTQAVSGPSSGSGSGSGSGAVSGSQATTSGTSSGSSTSTGASSGGTQSASGGQSGSSAPAVTFTAG